MEGVLKSIELDGGSALRCTFSMHSEQMLFNDSISQKSFSANTAPSPQETEQQQKQEVESKVDDPPVVQSSDSGAAVDLGVAVGATVYRAPDSSDQHSPTLEQSAMTELGMLITDRTEFREEILLAMRLNRISRFDCL